VKSILFVTLVCTFSALLCQTVAEPPANFTDENAGSTSNPYQISTLANLRWLSETVEIWGGFTASFHYGDFYVVSGDPKYFIQTADIEASETFYWNDGFGFSPIGTEYLITEGSEYIYTIYPFQGNYNGNNHTISNLYMDRRIYNTPHPSGRLRVIGLFGLIWHSTIANVHLENTSIELFGDGLADNPNLNQGRLVTSVNHSSILNCSSYGIMNNSSGLIGRIEYNSLVEYCSSITYGNISGGLLIYEAINSIVSNSFARGCTEFNSNLDSGLISYALYSNIRNVYIASIEGTTNVNWIVGGPQIFTVTYSIWDRTTSNTPNPYEGFPFLHPSCNILGCTGLSTAVMKIPSFYYNNWDFENIWIFDPDINDGFPSLRHDTIAQSLSASDNATVPVTSSLLGNYPNPFNPSTTIRFSVAKDSQVSLGIYNIKGQLVCRLVDNYYREGTHQVIWNGRDDIGRSVSSGVYFYRMTTGEFVSVRKMVLLK